MSPHERRRELEIRHAAFEWLDQRRAAGVELFKQSTTSGLVLNGEVHRLMPTMQGIWKPATLIAALSIRTAYRPEGALRPYDDSIGEDGRLRYKFRTGGASHSDNRALRAAMAASVPIIWWLGVRDGEYTPLYPVFITQEERDQEQFVVDIDSVPQPDLSWPVETIELDINYRIQLTKARLHQRPFRAAVLRAYKTSCAVCSFRHGDLLDAAHIQEDRNQGKPSVTNGMALCKMHHAAYDRNILGITPSYEVRVNDAVLAEVDGPMLRHGIQAFHGKRLMALPERRALRPDSRLLNERFQRFLSAN